MSRRSAFTLAELLAVTAVIFILAALPMPALVAAMETACRVQCMSRLHQIGLMALAG